MSSPCKKLKLTPKKKQGTIERQSQESKVTSTPQRPSGLFVSPNLSRICSSGSSIRTRLSHVFDEEITTIPSVKEFSKIERSSTSLSAEDSETNGDEDYDAYLNNLGKVKYTGNVWKQYKPFHEGTLYAQLLRAPQNAGEIITEFLILYNKQPEDAICNLLEFCVDICGFQNFDIFSHYNFQENASKRIIQMMESDDVLNQQTVLKTTGKYLFMESSRVHLAKTLKISIYNFLQKLIICAHERGILYDEFFAKHFFQFIKFMSFSELRAIRHTGVIFAIKIQTAIVKVFSKIINDVNYSSKDIDNTDDECFLQKQDLNGFLEYFYFIFIKNCRLQDNKVMLMRVECIRELCTWIKYFPKIFITQLQAVNYLIKLITDASRDVRYAALETCERLVETPCVLTILKNIAPDFTEAIGKRFYDVDIKVAIKSIDIFSAFLKYDESLITTHRFKLLIGLVFDKYFPIGEAAARFLISYLESSEQSEEIILIQLAKFSLKPGYATKQLLIEGCLHICPVIQNWAMYTSILLRNDVELYIKEALVEMLSESVHQSLTGKSTKMREQSRKVTDIDLSQHKEIVKYLPVFNELLKKYKDYPTILNEFLKIFLLLNNDAFNKMYYPDICETMNILFYYHDDEELLNKLVETFHYFCNITSLAKHARSIIDGICSKYANDLSVHLSKQSEELLETVMKVRILFSHFNLTKYFGWETLFDGWGKVDETVTCNLLPCCKWYLIWSLRNITDTDNVLKAELANQIVVCSRISNEFVSTSFNMLQNLNGQPLHFIAFKCLCDVHITFMKDLEHPIRVIKQLEKLNLTIDNQLQTLLVGFLDQYVISNTTMPLNDRRAYVVNYVDLVHHNVLPIECLAYIFKYYYAYNKEFGPIIESSLTYIAAATDENIFLMVVIYTITIVYEHLVSKYDVVDNSTEEAKELKLLIKQFLTFKEFRSAKRSFKKLIYFSCKYAFKHRSKYGFLYFTKYFVDLLIDNDDREEVFNFLKNKLPNGAKKNDAVLFIANYIKNFKVPAARTKKTATKEVAKENRQKEKPAKVVKGSRKRAAPKSKPILNVQKKTCTGKARKNLNISHETEVSDDDLTIHDSESDDLEESFTGLRI